MQRGAQIIAFGETASDGCGPRQFAVKDSAESSEPGNYAVEFSNFVLYTSSPLPPGKESKVARNFFGGGLGLVFCVQRSHINVADL